MPPSGVFKYTMDEDALIEAEIAHELEFINLDAEEDEDNVLNNDDLPPQEDEDLLYGELDVPKEASDYIKRIQDQSAAFEKELAECDELLYRSQSVIQDSQALVAVEDDPFILELAKERGESPTTYKKRILEELEKDSVDLSDEPFLTGDVVGLDEENGGQGGSTALVLLDEKTLEFQKMFRAEMEMLEKRQQQKEELMKMEIKEDREKENKETQEMEIKWKEKYKELQQEEKTLAKEREDEQRKFEEVAKKREQEIEIELNNFQRELDKMEAEAEKEKEEFIKAKEEERRRQTEMEERGALTIQRYYRGHVIRKQYREVFNQKGEERKKKKEEERIKEVEKELQLQREEVERKKKAEEEERLQKEREEKLKKETEERLKREEKERQKKEEEERLRKEEEERLRKEKEEQLRKEEEERQRVEKERQERLRLEEERRQEEERKREELRIKEKKKKEEEEKRRAEEEVKRKEEERKKEEAERKKMEEEKRKEELKKKLEAEEEMKRQEERKKIEEQERQKREAEEKLRREERLLKEKEEKQESVTGQIEREKILNDEKKRISIEDGQKEDYSKHNDVKLHGNARDRTFVSKKNVEKTFVVDKGATDNGASDDEFLDAEEDEKLRSKAVNGMLEGLPDSLEKKRLQWIKDCTPWSKVSNEPWKLKPASTKRAVRRPSSAKKLSPLDEKLILSAAHAATLRQVTTVELHDLPGCSVTPLGQCWGLKHLTMTNCNLTVIEGLQQCKQLQYVNFKDNKIEYLDLKDLGNITYVNLCSNNLSVIHGLNGCTNIRWLDLSHNKITRLGGLDSLRRIHTLILSHNQLISTSCLSDTPTVQTLDLSHNHLQKMEDMEKLCLLQTLKVSSNNLLELLSLENQVLLQELMVDDNSISSLAGLQKSWLPLLHTLNISQNSLEDLISLEQFHVLKHLDISTNQILEPDQITENISGCVYLESLNTLGNPATEGSQLQLSDKFPHLSTIDGGSVKKSHDQGTPIKPNNSFQAMCLTQIQLFRDIYHRFIQDVRQTESKSPIDVSALCDTYFKFCDKSHKVACDHRYAHEYGDITMAMPVAPSTPKSGRPRSSRSAKLVQKDEVHQNPKDLFNKTVVAQSIDNISSNSFEKYSDPKDLFNKAVSSENSKNSSQRNHVNGGIVNKEEMPCRNGLRSEKTVVITAKTVKDLMEKDPSIADESALRNAAATKIQAHWRGYSLRKYLYGDHNDDYHEDQTDFDSDMAVLQELHKAATKIQAVWRGYILRLRLERAIEFARFDDDDEDYLEVDLDDFNFNEDVLEDWRPPTTPQIPSAHPVLGKPPSGKQGSPPGKVPPLHLKEKNLPPVKPQRAWRGAESPLSDIHQNGHVPRPPPSVMSGTDTHRTANSKKEEKLSEEWGFKDTNTAHLMMQRAKKMKYNSERRKKLSKLDPKQRLALFRRLEETGTVRRPQYQPPSKQTLPRKEYFQARQEEMERQDLEKRVMHNLKNNRTYEWIHTQVGDYEVTDSAISQKNPVAKGRYGSEGNLPRMDPDVTAGRPPRLVASPSLDVQSVDSVSLQGEMTQPRRFSAGSEGTGRFPPIKTNSAGSNNSQGSRKRERMSWRNKEVNKSIGWGGGKKRGHLHE